MPEPRTHYQVSFTARQAVLFFVVFLGALAGAYFLGIATGIAGRPSAETVSAAAVATPAPTAAPAEAPARSLPTPPRPLPTTAPEGRPSPATLAAREPSSAGGIQFFEDRPEETPSAKTPSAAKKAPAPPPSAAGFWVQVVSTGSEKEANARRAHLASSGYHAAVSPTRGPKGPLYRVRVGPYSSREEAAKASEALDRKEKVKTWIVPPGE